VPILRQIAALLVAVVLLFPAAAMAQTPTIPQDGSGVSTQPPVQLGGDESTPQDGSLPDTGTDPRLLLLAGFALTLFGVGLRLRTADADLY